MGDVDWKKLWNKQSWIFNPFGDEEKEIEKPNLRKEAFKSIREALKNEKEKSKKDDEE